MIGFVITALNKTGTLALDQCIQEEKVELSKKSLIERLKFNKIWDRRTTRNPLTDSWFVNKDAIRFMRMDKNFSINLIVDGVVQAMLLNGAVKDIDYTIEVHDE